MWSRTATSWWCGTAARPSAKPTCSGSATRRRGPSWGRSSRSTPTPPTLSTTPRWPWTATATSSWCGPATPGRRGQRGARRLRPALQLIGRQGRSRVRGQHLHSGRPADGRDRHGEQRRLRGQLGQPERRRLELRGSRATLELRRRQAGSRVRGQLVYHGWAVRVGSGTRRRWRLRRGLDQLRPGRSRRRRRVRSALRLRRREGGRGVPGQYGDCRRTVHSSLQLRSARRRHRYQRRLRRGLDRPHRHSWPALRLDRRQAGQRVPSQRLSQRDPQPRGDRHGGQRRLRRRLEQRPARRQRIRRLRSALLRS